MANYEEIENLAAIENLEIQEINNRYRRRFYEYRNAFHSMSDCLFIKNFRLSKDLTRDLIELLRPYIRDSTTASSIPIESKVLIALNFLATGSYQVPVGSNEFLSVSQTSVSRSIHEVVEALNRPEIFNEQVKFPQTIQQLDSLRQRFFVKYGMPGVIGCIDCTHVAIVPPKRDDEHYPEHIYVNKKQYHSINTQLICDCSMKILHVNASFPGSTNDAYIWANSNVEPTLRNLYDRGNQGYFLLGDSGYSLRPWLITPLANPIGRAEERFNQRHKTIRSLNERCKGLLKMRFRCLLKHRFLHYHPTVCSKIINACAVLINANLQIDPEEDVDEDFGIFNHHDENENNFNINLNNPYLQAGRQMQRRLINQ